MDAAATEPASLALSTAAEETGLLEFSKKMRIFKQRAKSVMIVGGGKITLYLAKMKWPMSKNEEFSDKLAAFAADMKGGK